MSSRRIETVVRIRRLQERLATAKVADRQATLAAADRRAAAAWDEVTSRSADVTTSAASLIAHRDLLAVGVDEARSFDDATDVARDSVAEALAGWELAAQRREGVERLDERRVEAALDDEERRTFSELDDLTLVRWNRSAT